MNGFFCAQEKHRYRYKFTKKFSWKLVVLPPKKKPNGTSDNSSSTFNRIRTKNSAFTERNNSQTNYVQTSKLKKAVKSTQKTLPDNNNHGPNSCASSHDVPGWRLTLRRVNDRDGWMLLWGVWGRWWWKIKSVWGCDVVVGVQAGRRVTHHAKSALLALPKWWLCVYAKGPPTFPALNL